ncbi:MAG: flagellar hook-length control protein FliK [Lachnospiraceae bacterium]|nr:flagellar hook-length control protein FliK [Lachnospiraceae bacterium]
MFSPQSNIQGQGIAASQTATPASQAGSANTSALAVGSVISGQVVEAKGDAVTIQTDQGQLFQAKTEDGVALSKGSYVSFEVSKVSDAQVSLKALFTNTAAGSSTMSAALSQAGISETASSFGMVRSMMENGMPIDKNSLIAMYRQVSAHPAADSADIVSMTKLQLPLTEENISQFEAYRNLEHQITKTVDQVSDTLSQMVDDLANTDASKALSLAADLASVISSDGEGTSGGVAAGEQNSFVTLVDGLVKEDVEAAAKQVENNAEQGQSGTEIKAAASDNGGRDGAVDALLKALKEASTESGDTAKTAPVADEGRVIIKDTGAETSSAGQKVVIAEDGTKQTAAKEVMQDSSLIREFRQGSSQNQSELSSALKTLLRDTPPDKALSQISEGIEKLLSREPTPENMQRLAKAASLIKSDAFKDLMKQQLGEAWRLDPKSVAQKDQVQEFYNRLRSQTGKMAEVVEKSLGSENRLFEQVTNIRQNVDFMNQLNQAASYVQLPLKLAGDDAHGDLYVYTNKKNLSDTDGKVSAFLHLDMDHLGPVDVFVALEKGRVDTNFYLRDDEMIDFISENIDILNDRLAEKGYDMNCKVSMKQDKAPTSVMEEILEDHRDGFLIGSKSFDVRA